MKLFVTGLVWLHASVAWPVVVAGFDKENDHQHHHHSHLRARNQNGATTHVLDLDPTGQRPQGMGRKLTAFPDLKSLGNNPISHFPLGICEGDCDDDSQCAGDLVCFQRGKNDPVPGCEGGEQDNSRTDYCVDPNFVDSSILSQVHIRVFGGNPVAQYPLGLCQGDCDNNSQCAGELICFQREPNTAVPGCEGGLEDNSRTDYCIYPSAIEDDDDDDDGDDDDDDNEDIVILSANPSAAPSSVPSAVPSTQPSSMPSSTPSAEPTTSAPSGTPSSSPTVSLPPTSAPTVRGPKDLVWLGVAPNIILDRCEGDCDIDADCRGILVCFQRTGLQEIPGCSGSGINNGDYCVHPDDIP